MVSTYKIIYSLYSFRKESQKELNKIKNGNCGDQDFNSYEVGFYLRLVLQKYFLEKRNIV